MTPRTDRHRRQRGAVLVEFALVALVLVGLFAAVLDLGRLTFTTQVAQDVARVAARELALTPLPAGLTFDEALVYVDPLADVDVPGRVYSPDHLVIDLDTIPGGDIDGYFATLPVVNRALRPLMIFEDATVGGATRRLLRVPGALVSSPTAPSGLSVLVPVVTARDESGVETIEWRAVVEEVRPDLTDPATGPFSIFSPQPEPGYAAVRVNVAFQAAGLTAHLPDPSGPFEPNVDDVIVADDGAVVAPPPPGGVALVGGTPLGPNAGPYGLGVLLAQAQEVRPFRRVVAAQALFRREVFDR